MIPLVTVSGSPNVIQEGGTATFTVSASAANPAGPITVLYTLSGKAKVGVDFNVSGTVGQVVIPTGHTSANIVLTALSDILKESSERVNLTLNVGPGYTLSRAKGQRKADIVIQNIGGTKKRH